MKRRRRNPLPAHQGDWKNEQNVRALKYAAIGGAVLVAMMIWGSTLPKGK
jgi:hypothetical protein